MRYNPEYDRSADGRHFVESEWGCAERFIAEWGGIVRYCPELGRDGMWLIWGLKPGTWSVDRSGDFVSGLAQETCSRMDDVYERAAGASFIRSGNIKNVLKTARPSLLVEMSEFDVNPTLLNTPIGVVNLRTGVFREWAVGEKFFMQTTVSPDFGGDCPLWLSHIERMCRNTKEPKAVARYIKRCVGMTLIGDQDEKPHIAPVLCGEGRNGKGSFADTLRLALGGYAGQGSARLLTAGEGDHTTEQAGLEGLRMVTIEEVLHINPSLFKMMTGGGRIRARKMRADDREFDKSWTMWIINNKPVNWRSGDKTSSGLWSRVPTVLLGEEMDERDRDERWSRRLEGELGAILAWAIEGCIEWMNAGGGLQGLEMPECVRETTAERKESADPLGIFIDEFYEPCSDVGCNVTASAFMKRYTQWCKDTSEPSPGGRNTVYAELRERLKYRVEKGKGGQIRIYGMVEKPVSLASLSESYGTGLDWEVGVN